MTAVVLRCPHCGTTRGTPGECEACHEEDVRYYCSNHSPGRWLDGPACGQCGARFGEPARRPPAPVPAPARPRAAPPAAAPRPGALRPGPPRRVPVRPRHREESEDRDSRWPPDVGAGRRAPPAGDGRRPPEEASLGFGWEDLLRHAERARSERAAPPMPRMPAGGGLRVGGCLVRLALMLVLLVFALFSGLFLFAGSLFQLFRVF